MEKLFPDERDQRSFEDLMRAIKGSECILFVGAGLSRELGLPSGSDLARELARECDYPPDNIFALSHVAQYYENRFDRRRLFERVRALIERPVLSRGPSSYDLIAEIEKLNRTIITTNWDNQLEQALRRKGKPVRAVRYDEQVGDISHPYTILKLHGDFEARPKEVILTRDDMVHAYKQVTQPGGLFGQVGAMLATKTFLFVGYSLDDEDFRLLYDRVREVVGAGLKMHYAVMPNPSYVLRDEWRGKGIIVLDSTAKQLFEAIFKETHKFVNREDEVEYICTRTTKPYIEVHGFAGCGKTSLLLEVWDRYQISGLWKWACISFEEPGEGRMGGPFVYLGHKVGIIEVADEIARQTTGQGIRWERLRDRARTDLAQEQNLDLEAVPDEAIDERVGELMAREIAERLAHEHTLFLFDSSERIPEPVFRWIERALIPALEEAVASSPEDQLRFVFAGRMPLHWRSPRVKLRLHVFRLTPFSEAAVSAMLNSFAALQLRDPLPSTKRNTIVKNVLDISSGHPRCIRNLLKEIAQRGFDVTEEYFERGRKRLFEEHVVTVLDGEILNKVRADIRDIFHTVCVFRRLSADILDILMQRGYIKADFPDALTLLGALRNTYLLTPPAPSPMYPLDAVVRRALAMRMELTQLERYRALNELAVNTFENWIAEVAAGGEQLAYIIEALFHHLQLSRLEGRSGDEVERELRSKLKDYLRKLRPTEPYYRLPLLEQLKEELEGDEELLDGVAELVPGDGYRTLVGPVEEAHEQLLKEV